MTLPRKNPANFQVVGEIALGTAGAAEITAYDPLTQKLFVVSNDSDSRIDVVDLQDPAQPALLSSIDIAPYGGGANSVAVNDGLLAVAVEADPAQEPGKNSILCHPRPGRSAAGDGRGPTRYGDLHPQRRLRTIGQRR